jgi:hypothetical protein
MADRQANLTKWHYDLTKAEAFLQRSVQLKLPSKSTLLLLAASDLSFNEAFSLFDNLKKVWVNAVANMYDSIAAAFGIISRVDSTIHEFITYGEITNTGLARTQSALEEAHSQLKFQHERLLQVDMEVQKAKWIEHDRLQRDAAGFRGSLRQAILGEK